MNWKPINQYDLDNEQQHEYVLVGWFDQFDKFYFTVARQTKGYNWIDRKGNLVGNPDYFCQVSMPNKKK